MPVACQNVDVWPPFHVSIYHEWSGKSDVFIEVSQVFFVIRGLSEEFVDFLRLKVLVVISNALQRIVIFGVIKK